MSSDIEDIPTVLTANELLDKAFRRAAKVQVTDKIKVYKDRKTAVAKLDSVADTIQGTLNKYIKAFPDLATLHPFDRELMSLTIDLGHLKRSLGAMGWAGAQIRRIAASQARTLKTTKNTDFISKKMEEAYGRISSIVKQVGKDLVFVDKARNTLQALPVFDPQAPVIVIAGFPNSGKSQLVRAMSTGKPVVAHYPFTTKDVTLGHFKQRYLTYIVIDTPGLLDRPLEKRNDIEKKAILALRYLADVIVFIIDPTCLGGEMQSQLHLLVEIERDFGENATIIPVYGKCDVTQDGDQDLYRVSGKTGDGVKELTETAANEARKVKTDKVMDAVQGEPEGGVEGFEEPGEGDEKEEKEGKEGEEGEEAEEEEEDEEEEDDDDDEEEDEGEGEEKKDKEKAEDEADDEEVEEDKEKAKEEDGDDKGEEKEKEEDKDETEEDDE